jgi:CheY-like chemotaxis protein
MDTINILLADDDEDDRLLFEEALQKVRHSVKCKMVHNGGQLMEYLQGLSNGQLPHLLFLDLNMPIKSGLECLAEIRADPFLRELTVAIYSTSSSAADIESTFIKGANVYINKPADFNQLVKILSDVITLNWQYQRSELNKENFVLSIE